MHYDGLVNFRDIGGVPSRHGGEVRAGALFRSGMFSLVGPDAADIVALELGVDTIVDLRTDGELAKHPTPVVYTRHDTVEARHIPFFYGHEFAAVAMPGGFDPEPWATRYVAYTDHAGRFALPRVIDAILDNDASPTVFHCWSGKDRTGVTAAVILDLLGVDDVLIGEDYEASMHWWHEHLDHRELDENEPLDGYRTVAGVILQTLAGFRSLYGSVEAMLLASGMHESTPNALRTALLD